ncbi:MAG: transposase [Pedobacter sp.]|nr:transposase [Pedobacter sp.]
MSEKQKNNYSSEFKASAVKLAAESGQSIAKTARDLGVNKNTLYSWIAEYSHSNKTNQNNMTSKNEYSFEEVNRLKKELAMVKQERDLLKKAAAYFAKESR